MFTEVSWLVLWLSFEIEPRSDCISTDCRMRVAIEPRRLGRRSTDAPPKRAFACDRIAMISAAVVVDGTRMALGRPRPDLMGNSNTRAISRVESPSSSG